MVFTINLKFFVRYIGVFGFPNCQKSAKSGPIYFNKNWSAEKCPLNWSCPLFLESAKLEFHCTESLQCYNRPYVPNRDRALADIACSTLFNFQ